MRKLEIERFDRTFDQLGRRCLLLQSRIGRQQSAVPGLAGAEYPCRGFRWPAKFSRRDNAGWNDHVLLVCGVSYVTFAVAVKPNFVTPHPGELFCNLDRAIHSGIG